MNWNKLSNEEGTIDESWESFVNVLRKLIEAYIPVYKDTPRFKRKLPYINNETKKKLTDKKKAWIRYLSGKTEVNFKNYNKKNEPSNGDNGEAKYNYEKDLARNINKFFWK